MTAKDSSAADFSDEEALDGIAIVGLAGKFAGALNAGEFWRNLVAGKDGITRFTDEELTAAGYDPERVRAIPGYVGARGLIERPEWFDRAFFGIAPKEAEITDPQQRVFFEIAWDAMEDAGCDPSRFGGLIGVFAGMSNNTYYPFFVRQRRDLMDAAGVINGVIGNEKDFLSTRLAYKLNLRGPALSIQTACSTSLVAVCVAAQHLRDHQCDVALAGGVSVTFPQARGYFHQEGGMTSADGWCRPFDIRANGTVFSNGAGVVVLKRLADAVAEGDQIYAVIKGHALNNDGAQKVSYAAPSVSGHTEVIGLAHAVAGFAPESISYIEAHGTATPLGDPIEIAALTQVFGAAREMRDRCAIGSVKGNIGHCDAASGIASLIKTALAFRYGQLPPTLHCEQPNPALRLEDSPFFLNTDLRPWPRSPEPRRAGVSSFGVGGTNAHVVLEEAPDLPAPKARRTTELLVLSAKTASALEARASDLATHLEAHPEEALSDVAYTLQTGRQTFQHRRFVVAGSHAAAVAGLRNPAKLKAVEDRLDTPTAFLFPGQGSQFPRMGAQLFESEPAFRDALDECTEDFRSELGLDLRTLLFSQEETAAARLKETRITQPAIFAVSWALARFWQSLGLQPAALLGHSVGEFVAAALAGVFTLKDATRLVATRARLVQELPHGAMLAARLTESEAAEFLEDSKVAIAAVNSPKLCVLAGPFEAIETVEATLKGRNVAARRLATSHAFHSPMVDPVVAPFAATVRTVELHRPAIPIVSSVTGDWLSPEQAMDPAYWSHHLRATVRFSDAIEKLLAQNTFAFLEAGPGQALNQLVRQHAAKTARHEVVSPLVEGSEENESVAAALGRLWMAGVPCDWKAIHSGDVRRRVSLPSYPFERQRYFADLPPGIPLPLATAATDNEPPPDTELPLVQSTRTLLQEPENDVGERQTVQAPEPEKETGGELLELVKTILGDLSGIDLSTALASTRLLELGFDSLFLSQTAISLSRRFGVKITLRQLLGDLGTLEALAAHVSQGREQTAGAIVRRSAQPKRIAPTVFVSSETEPAHGPFRPMQRALDADLTTKQRGWLTDFIGRYNARTAASKKFTSENRGHLADPRAVSGFKQAWKELVYPIVVDHSAGARLWDVDGNEWIDNTMSFGAAMLGHQPPFVVAAIQAQLERGIETGPTSPLAGEVAALLCKLTGMERAAFCNTGTEAVSGALRIARTVTGRPRIVYFRESYHGIADEVLGRSGAGGAIPIAPGIPAEALTNVMILDYGDHRSLDQIAEWAEDIAAVLVEPVQSRRPELQPKAFLHELRTLTKKHGIALIFDELITGFRCDLGGAQAYFGVEADIATYGKVLGGGLPIGVIAGSAKFLDALDGGQWSYGDDSFPEAAMTFFAGTFVRHPLALASARAVLTHLEENGRALQQSLSARAEDLIGKIGAAVAGTPFSVQRFTSSWVLHAAADCGFSGLFHALLRHRGLHIWENRPCFVSTAHTDADLEQIARVFAESIAEMEEAGFFTRSSGEASLPVRAIPSTESQRELWLLCEQSQKASTACNETWTLRLEGALDFAAMQSAVQSIVDRHESLRATFDRSGETLKVAPSLKFEVPVVDLSKLNSEERTARFDEMRVSEGLRVFNLEKGPLLVVQLVRMGEADTALLFNAHHLVCDGWSCDVFLRELSVIYSALQEGKPHGLPAPMQFREYERWEASLRETTEFAADADYWFGQYRTIPAPLDLPGDRPRPVRRSFQAANEIVTFPLSFAQDLQRLGSRHGATLFTVLLAGFKALLSRLSGQEDIVVGVAAAGQNLAGGEHLVGHCVNMLPVRGTVEAGQSFTSLLAETKVSVLDAFDHQRVTFGWLLQNLQVPRRPGRTPLVSAIFNLDPPLNGLRFSGLRHRLDASPRQSYQFDLGFNCDCASDEFRLVCNYNTDLFDGPTIRQWAEQFRALLEAAASEGSASVAADGSHFVSLAARPESDFSEPEQQWLAWSKGKATPFPAEFTVPQIFEQWANRTPDATAVVDGDSRWSYAELHRRSSAIARFLRAKGLRNGAFIGLPARKSAPYVAEILGILKAGCAYVPIDPFEPAERQALKSRHCSLVLSGSEKFEESDALAKTEPFEPANPTAAAYVLHTSGSTGEPKGVVVPHCGITRLVCESDWVALRPDDVFAFHTNLSFDVSTLEIWGALLNGASLVVTETETVLSAAALGAHLARHGITFLSFTTAVFNRLSAEASAVFAPLRTLVFGGEAADAVSVRRVLESGRPGRLVNAYGPTEATTVAICHRIDALDGDVVPIGRPIANTDAFILDAELRPVEEGELHLGGPGVAIGYLDDTQLTSERFVQTPFGRLYKTGDVGRWRPDGTIEFLGRKDQQIKLRGYRIEPGEIEAAIRRVAKIGECKVAAREVLPGERQLVAYYTRNGAPPPSGEAIRSELTTILPEYMVPRAFLEVPIFPLTANGKLALDELPLPSLVPGDRGIPIAESQNTVHAQIIEIWETVLAHRPIGIRDDFFALGGHSLLAVQMLSLVEERLGVRPSLSTLFENATIEHLAENLLEERLRAAAEKPYALIHGDGGKRPFFFLHGDFVGGGFFCRSLADQIGADRPFYAVHPHGLHGGLPHSIPEMAADRLAAIRAAQPEGPYLLGGYCNGALVAFEMARMLEAAGETVSSLVLLMADGSNYKHRRLHAVSGMIGSFSGENDAAIRNRFRSWREKSEFLSAATHQYATALRGALRRPFSEEARTLVRKPFRIGKWLTALESNAAEIGSPRASGPVAQAFLVAAESYVPGDFGGTVTILWPVEEAPARGHDPTFGWASVCAQVNLVRVPGAHHSCVASSENLRVIGVEMGRALKAADAADADSRTNAIS